MMGIRDGTVVSPYPAEHSVPPVCTWTRMTWDLCGWRDVNWAGNLGGEAPAEWGKVFVPIFQEQ